MNKSDFIRYIAEDSDISVKQATVEVERVFGAVASALKTGDDVNIVGFGKWEHRKRAARAGRNPQTGEAIDIPESATIGFKASEKLKDVAK
jgi:DNA-binding protein HU-beta